jgi:hypothetical protein
MTIIQETINNLWYWTYGMVVGWGASFTILLALVILLSIKIIRLNRKLNYLEGRVVANERDHNLEIKKVLLKG